jgi:hypothetical protein
MPSLTYAELAHSLRITPESAKTTQAIAAFEAIARRLEAMAEARRPSWWPVFHPSRSNDFNAPKGPASATQ